VRLRGRALAPGLPGDLWRLPAELCRPGRGVARRASEGVEVSDVLGKELMGKAILVGWDPGPQERKPDEPPFSPEESLDELEVLCNSLNLEVKERVLQKWRPDRSRHLPLGRGKTEELRQQVKYDPEIGVVVFDKDLSYRSLLTLKGRIAPQNQAVLIDRTSLILRIFAARARTPEARLQVTLAEQKYMLPRLRYYLTEGGGLEARGGSGGRSGAGGAALKGKGETQLSQDKSMLARQMAGIKRKLEEVRKQRGLMRQGQRDLGMPVVSLVGYTNAGKSSLLNRLCGASEVTAKDRLFETLDTTHRRVKLATGREVMLVDTVGFVQRLPEQLVAGFRATLEELEDATVVLHVVDISSSTAAQQVGTVMQTLARLKGFDTETPQLLVFNKIDKLEGGIAKELEQTLEFPWPGVVGHCQISALTGAGLSALSDAIEATLVERTRFGAKSLKLLIPYTESSLYAKVRGPPPMAKINHEEHTPEGYLIEVTADEAAARQLQRFEVAEPQTAA